MFPFLYQDYCQLKIMFNYKVLIGILGMITCSNALSGIDYPDKLWALAHMTNNEEALDYALNAGANGLEMDLTVDEDGSPATLYHNWFCDCVCGSPEMCDFDTCNNARPVVQVLEHFMQHPLREQVALIYIDSKLGEVEDKEDAARKMVKMLNTTLLEKGYQGKILIGSDNEVYLTALTVHARATPYQDQIYIGYDSHTDFKEGLELLAGVDYPNKIASAGMTRCFKWAVSYTDEVSLGRVNKARGVISDMIIWTLDDTNEYNEYYEAGARGIISNNIKKLVQWARENNLELYAPGDDVHVTGQDPRALVTDLEDCGCEKSGTGCKIEADDMVTVAGAACHCNKYGFFCTGKVVACSDINSHYCLNPDDSEESCLQGGGNCDGY